MESPFSVTMAADGFTIEPADETHVHLADGASEATLELAAGEHTLCLQAGDGQHAALDLTDEITITVGGGGETTTEPEEGEALEDWVGTYAGEVEWDCGAAGTHRGTLEAEVVVLTYEGGLATMDAEHTVFGSCADTGDLTTRSPSWASGPPPGSGSRPRSGECREPSLSG